MPLLPLVLTLTSSLNGINQTAVARKINQLKADSQEIISRAMDDFNFDDMDLSLDNLLSLVKDSILQYNEENELLNETYLSQLSFNSAIIDEDTLSEIQINEADFLEMANSFRVENTINDLPDLDLVQRPLIGWDRPGYYDGANGGTSGSLTNPLPWGISQHDGSGEFFGGSTGGSTGETTTNQPSFPHKDVNPDLINYFVNQRVDGVNFVGIAVSRDACMEFYNLVGTLIDEDFHQFVGGVLAALSLVAAAGVAAAIGALTGYFSSIWAGFCSLFTSGGIVGIIVGIIIGLVGAACIAVMATMFVMGAFEKGFAVGWKVPNIFSWNWYCGEID